MKMRIAVLVVLALMIVALPGVAQFKSQIPARPSVSEAVIQQGDNGLMFGFFDPAKLTMRQSYSISYMTMGGQGLSIGQYTNSLFYQFSDRLDLQTDITFTHTPYNSFGNKLGYDWNGLRLSRVALNYRPTDNSLIQLQFRQAPAYDMYSGYGYGYGSSLGFGSDFTFGRSSTRQGTE